MPVYRIDMMICATAYIKATSAAEAERKAKALAGKSPDVLVTDSFLARAATNIDHMGGVPISGLQYSNPRLPDVSFSPAMTIHEPWNGAEPELTD